MAAVWFTAIAITLIWAQFRGFDLLDGGYYFLTYQHPAETTDSHTHFQYLARPIWLLCNQNIVAFRIATLIAVAVPAFVFAKAFDKRFNLPSSALAALAIVLWALAGVTWSPVALTYNSLATIFQFIGLAMLLFRPAASRGRPSLARAGAWCAGFFAVLMLTALAKPPAAISLSLVGVTVLVYDHEDYVAARRLRYSVAVCAFVVLAAAVALLAYLLLRPSFHLLFLGLDINGLWIVANFGRYMAELAKLAPKVVADSSLLAVAALILVGAARGGLMGPRFRRPLAVAGIALLIAITAAEVIARRLWDGSFARILDGGPFRFFCLAWLVAAVASVCRPRDGHEPEEASPRRGVWVLVLGCLPLFSSFGSTNAVYVSAMHETAFFAAGGLLALSDFAVRYRAEWVWKAFAVLSAAVASGAIVSGAILRPYMFQPSLLQQTTEIEVGDPATTLRVDSALADFLKAVRRDLNAAGYHAGDDAFGFFNLPGVIFAIGASEPGAPWYFGTWYHNNDNDGQKIRRVSPMRLKRAWIITQADVTGFKPRFRECGIDFPGGYLKIGSVRNPATGLEVEMWKPK